MALIDSARLCNDLRALDDSLPLSYRAKNALSKGLMTVLGRRGYARLARFMWMASRLDTGGHIDRNGERKLQAMFAARQVTRGARPLRVLDVGANVGDWTASLLSELGDAGVPLGEVAISLFEPAPEPRDALTRRFGSSRADITIEKVALADESGTARFSIFGETDGINTLQPLSGTPSRVIEVQQQTVDAFCEVQAIEHIHLMKIDTEGNDLRVLRGARGMLEAGRIDFVQFEYNHLWIAFRFFLKDVFDLMQPLGYSVGKVTPLGIEKYPEWHHELESFRLGNYLLWREPLPEGFETVAWWNA